MGIDTALIGNLNDSLVQHVGLLNGKAATKRVWSIWLCRNDAIFKEQSLDFCKVTDDKDKGYGLGAKASLRRIVSHLMTSALSH